MKYIEVDEELYRYIASKTEHIGESASDILRRILGLKVESMTLPSPDTISHPSLEQKQKAQINAKKPAAKPTKPAVKKVVSVSESLRNIDTQALAEQKGAVGRFLFLLNEVYQAAPSNFDQVLKIQGRDRLYFATSKEALLKVSKSANPKEIGDSGYWVTSNNNTAKKRTILSEVLAEFGASNEQVAELSNSI